MYLKARLKRGKEHPQRITERYGIPSIKRPEGKLLWFHAASVGESVSLLPLIHKLAESENLRILITTGTLTSAKMLEDKLPKSVIHQFVPADCKRWVQRFLNHWQPDVGIWVESELWPNLVISTARTGAGMMLINARISDRSFLSKQKMPSLTRLMLGCFNVILPQSRLDATRFTNLGAMNVEYLGNLKYASEKLAANPDEVAKLSAQIAGRPAWLAASTHPGEEEQIIATHKQLRRDHPNLLTIIAPRHPVRAPEVTAILEGGGITYAQRSRGQNISTEKEVYLADTLGELGILFELVDVVFIGGSLVAVGGHNPLEPARAECVTIYGPHIFNFAEICSEMEAANASIKVSDSHELSTVTLRLLNNKEECEKIAINAREFADSKKEILGYVLIKIREYL
jgi:3-deoxy-D-manno-octulosonic-acid transferase